ncbi:MAG: hypothetical protein ACJ8IR_03855 [Alphaproteobacteria bacterium]
MPNPAEGALVEPWKELRACHQPVREAQLAAGALARRPVAAVALVGTAGLQPAARAVAESMMEAAAWTLVEAVRGRQLLLARRIMGPVA